MAEQTTAEKFKRFLLIIFITLLFVGLMYILRKSFELARNPIPETASGGVKKIHREYLVGINIVILSYIYFLVLTYIVFTWIHNSGFFNFLFYVINFSLNFALLVMSADSLTKMKNDNEVPEDLKKEYKKLMEGIVGISTLTSALWGLPLLYNLGSLLLSKKKTNPQGSNQKTSSKQKKQ